MGKMKTEKEIEPKLIKHLEGNTMFLDRQGKKIRFVFPHSKNKKFAILEELYFKKEEYAKQIENYFLKTYGGNGVGEIKK